MKAWIASRTDRQLFWLKVAAIPFAPLWIVGVCVVTIAALPVLLLFMAADEVIDSLHRWASGQPQRACGRPPR